jgi:hypothetical protein
MPPFSVNYFGYFISTALAEHNSVVVSPIISPAYRKVLSEFSSAAGKSPTSTFLKSLSKWCVLYPLP